VTAAAQRAVRRLRKAAEGGLPRAQAELGWRHARRRDYRKARLWWERAAAQGHVESQNDLGELLRDGEPGVPRDRRAAFPWLLAAAKGGHPTAMLSVGYACFYGAGTARDLEEAKRWYERSARHRLPTAPPGAAASNLGHMYRKGEGVRQDWDEALRWYHRAARRGSVTAWHWLGRIYGGIEALPEDPPRAIRWLTKAAEAGDAQSQCNLGVYVFNGKKGIPEDRRKAVSLYRAAAAQRDEWATYLLGLCYRDGEGVRKNRRLARRWFERASALGVRKARTALATLVTEKKARRAGSAHRA
jgi:TPR repeat protein